MIILRHCWFTKNLTTNLKIFCN